MRYLYVMIVVCLVIFALSSCSDATKYVTNKNKESENVNVNQESEKKESLVEKQSWGKLFSIARNADGTYSFNPRGNWSYFQFKLTHVGDQLKPIKTIVLFGCDALPLMKVFHQCRTKNVSYGNDDSEWINFSTLLDDEIKAVSNILVEMALDKTQPEKEENRDKSLMIMVENGEGKYICAEVFLDWEKAEELKKKLAAALRKNSVAFTMLGGLYLLKDE